MKSVVFNLRQIKRRAFFFGHPVGLRLLRYSSEPDKLSLSVSLGEKPESESLEGDSRGKNWGLGFRGLCYRGVYH